MHTPGGYPSTRKDNLVIQDLEQEVLVYDLLINKAYYLNETSSMVWRMCDGTKSADEISRSASKKTGLPISEDIVWLALNQFKKDNLLEDSKDFATIFDGLSRREIVKKVGFASVVALPVISSVIAPSAVHAQSACVTPMSCAMVVNATTPNNLADGCFCLSNLNCLSGICPTGAMVCSGVTGNLCNELGNNVGASAPCCPCQSNLDCAQGICPTNTMICAQIN